MGDKAILHSEGVHKEPSRSAADEGEYKKRPGGYRIGRKSVVLRTSCRGEGVSPCGLRLYSTPQGHRCLSQWGGLLL
jgi:hypothetical protein